MLRVVPQAGIEPATYRLEASEAGLGTKLRQYLPPVFLHTHRRGGGCLPSIVPPNLLLGESDTAVTVAKPIRCKVDGVDFACIMVTMDDK